jgi:transposase
MAITTIAYAEATRVTVGVDTHGDVHVAQAKAQLGPAELAKLRRVLDRGGVQAGFDNDLWTLARVATVIEQVTGVAHHPGHVWRILKAMRWSLQRPARKAVERDEAEIARWVAQEWPRIAQRPNAQSLAVLRRRVGRQAAPPRCAGPGRPRAARRCCATLPAWQADLDVAAWWPTGPARTTKTSRQPGWASTCWRAPTTPGSSSACWTGWATSSATSR